MDLSLRLLTPEDAPALQRVYDAAPATFTRLLGRPAPPGQAARDIEQARATPGRYQFGAILDGELVGLVDCRLAGDVPGQAGIGLLLLPDDQAGSPLAALLLRIVTRWLAGNLGVCRLETGVPAHDAAALEFWESEGFELTGRQYRRELPGFNPRFLVLACDLPPAGT